VLVPVPDLHPGQNQIDLSRGPGPGRLYYTLQLQSYLPAEDATAESHGLSMAREYLAPDGSPLGQVHVGDLVLVRLTVFAPTEMTHLIVEDPLPAGLEAVDLSLNTTSLAARGILGEASKQRGWWWARQELRDDNVALFTSYLPRGAHEFAYLARASIAGQYRVLPVHAFEQYFPSVLARTDGQRFAVLP
jgi:uncharacterized protein YfaS (alpha-2-macroglobulin family)